METSVEIRLGNKNDIHVIVELLIDTWRSCYKDFIPADFLEGLNLEMQIKRHTRYMQGSAKYFVAENNFNELVGFSSYGKNRNEK